jgi:hypothetical protein
MLELIEIVFVGKYYVDSAFGSLYSLDVGSVPAKILVEIRRKGYLS